MNVAGRDWRRLVAYCAGVFGSLRIPPGLDVHGEALDAASGPDGADMIGADLRLPGSGCERPKLEFLTFDAADRDGNIVELQAWSPAP